MDETERGRLIAKVATDAAELLATMRRERDRRRAAGGWRLAASLKMPS